jgi:hypothetical protein
MNVLPLCCHCWQKQGTIFSLHFLSSGAKEQEAGLEPLTIGVMRYLFFHCATTTGHKKEIYIFSLSHHLGEEAGLEPLTLGMVSRM